MSKRLYNLAIFLPTLLIRVPIIGLGMICQSVANGIDKIEHYLPGMKD